MPPLVCPSPDVIDYSFPRSVEDLRKIASALARLIEGIQNGEFGFLLTEPLRGIIQNAEYTFDWSKVAEFPQLGVVYSTLVQIGLQQWGVQSIDLRSIDDYIAHPIPVGCESCKDIEMWADEIGRLLVLHDSCRDGARQPFIGVACTYAFSGSGLGTYDNPDVTALPLVGPNEIAGLGDAEDWNVNGDWERRSISFNQAKTNVRLLGGVLSSPTGSSHYQVQFKGGRTWPLDSNYKEVPEQYLKELVSIVKLELRVIKYILIRGEWPDKIHRLRIR